MGDTWVIIPFANVIQQMIDDCVEGSINKARHSIDGVDRIILKWDGSTPPDLIGYTQYDHTEICLILQGTDWSEAYQA